MKQPTQSRNVEQRITLQKISFPCILKFIELSVLEEVGVLYLLYYGFAFSKIMCESVGRWYRWNSSKKHYINNQIVWS